MKDMPHDWKSRDHRALGNEWMWIDIMAKRIIRFIAGIGILLLIMLVW